VRATNLIPGPNSTEMEIHLGHRQAGAGIAGSGNLFYFRRFCSLLALPRPI